MKSVFSLVAGFTLLFLSSCQPEEKEVAVNPDPPKGSSIVEEAYPGQTGTVEKGTLYGQAVEFSRINGDPVFEGDIILTPEQLTEADRGGATEGAGRTKMSSRWPYNTVYYKIDAALPLLSKTRVAEAIAYWQANARIKFVVRTTQPNYVTFRPGSGCSSSVGMVGGQQYINISTGCSKGSIIHEINHTLGVWHEQSRKDRDANVKIHWANISPGYDHNFKTYIERGVDGFDHGPFNLGSIMMYGPYSFSKNGLPTITRKNGTLYTVQRDALSAGDKATFVTMYQSKAALHSGPKTYFFSGNRYIRVTRGDTGAGTVDAGYPQPISNWGWGSFGKQGINASLYSGTKCYFFSGNQYIRVTRGDTGPGTVDPGYPRHISTWTWPASFRW